MTELWDKQPKESSLRYFAFCRYRDMGPLDRSLAKVAKELEPIKTKSKLGQLQEWSAKDNWVARVTAWDVEQDKLQRIEHQKALKAMAKKHVDIALTIQGKAAKRLKQLNPDILPDDLSPMDALRFMEMAIKLERQTLGEPDQIIQHTGEIKTEVTSGLSEQILSDPEAADLACKLYERLRMGKSNTSGAGVAGKP
jgi:hypothetical protein